MKKTITVITLALLMVASLFAETYVPKTAGNTEASGNSTTTTKVQLTIDKTPTYIFGINKNASITIDTKNVPSTKIDNTDTIELTRYTATDSGKNVLDVKPNAEYKLSYLFYEYDAVTLTMSLSGNLKLSGSTGDNVTDNSSADQIPYLVEVKSSAEKDQDNNTTKTSTAVTLDSTATTTTWSTTGYIATTKLGQYVSSTLALTISPKFSTESTTSSNQVPTLKGKNVGTYTSTITLTVTAN